MATDVNPFEKIFEIGKLWGFECKVYKCHSIVGLTDESSTENFGNASSSGLLRKPKESFIAGLQSRV